MAQFIAYLDSRWEDGCNHAVGCGQRLEPLTAQNYEEASLEVRGWFDPRSPKYNLSQVLGKIVIYEVVRSEEFNPWHIRQEQAERAEYERLKRKYEAVS